MQSPPPLPVPPAFPPQTPARQSMLAWWGVIPLVIFIAVECYFGLAQADAGATLSEHDVGRLMARIFAALLISLLLAYIVYRIDRGSQLTATIAFSGAILMLAGVSANSGLMRRAAARSTMPAAAPAGSVTMNDFPLSGISVGGPFAWVALPSDKNSVVTRWVPAESMLGNTSALVMVEVLKPQDGLDQIAGRMAAKWGGQVVSQHDSMDGETAWRIRATPSAPGLQPVEGLLTIHEGRLYLIEGGQAQGHSCQAAVEAVRQNWKWIPIESAAKHLEFRSQPVPLFDAEVLINYPALMKPFDAGKGGKKYGVGLFNLKYDSMDFDAMIQLVPLPKDDTLETVEDRLGRGTQAKYNLPEAFRWHQLKGRRPGAITQSVAGPSDPRANRVMWAIISVDDDQIVMINYTIYAHDPADRAAYEAAAEKIAESVSLPGGG